MNIAPCSQVTKRVDHAHEGRSSCPGRGGGTGGEVKANGDDLIRPYPSLSFVEYNFSQEGFFTPLVYFLAGHYLDP